MVDNFHPTKDEIEFLNLAYNRFLDLFEEIMKDDFWDKDAKYRLHRFKDMFSVYAELLHYPPIQWVIAASSRPNFSDVAKDLFRFIRHVLSHFSFFDVWDEIWVNCSLVNAFSEVPQAIDRFLTLNEGKGELKYRFWEEDKKRMTYVSIRYPKGYTTGEKIYLREMLTEKEGLKFSAIFMRSVLGTQIEEIST